MVNNSKKILEKIKVNPSKKYGQNFLINQEIIKKIAHIINLVSVSTILEIGPGLGSISQLINLDGAKNYFAVELDKKLYGYLISDFKFKNNIKFINADFLKWDYNQVIKEPEVFLFGNIPYSITTPILLKFLEDIKFKKAIFMVQKEYFERINQSPKNKNFSSISVLIQAHCDLKKLLNVNKFCFQPVPKVDSVVFQIEKKPNFNLAFYVEFKGFIRVCFAMKRKTIYNNLKIILTPEKIVEMMDALKLNLNDRPETFSVNNYYEMFLYYKKLKNG